MARQRIALFGGTFDPIHFGHLLLAARSYEALNLDRVIFIPAGRPPHKAQPIAGSADRLQMIRLAISGETRFLVCDCELIHPEPSYTIDTVRRLQGSLGRESDLFWLIGSDMLPDLNTWHKAGELVDLINITVLTRPGHDQPDLSSLRDTLTDAQIERIKANIIQVPLIDISSTDIRQRLGRNQSVRYFLPCAVLEYIAQHHLYLA